MTENYSNHGSCSEAIDVGSVAHFTLYLIGEPSSVRLFVNPRWSNRLAHHNGGGCTEFWI